MVNDARTAAGADDGADYLAAVEALCSLGERTERELAGAADYGRGELREAASRRRSREQEWERLERRAAQAERTARSLAHAHDVGVDADAPVPDAPAGAADTGRELSRVEADLRTVQQEWARIDSAAAERPAPVEPVPAAPAPPAPAAPVAPAALPPVTVPLRRSTTPGAAAGTMPSSLARLARASGAAASFTWPRTVSTWSWTTSSSAEAFWRS